MDEEFLDEVFNADNAIGEVDEFVGQLWKGWKKLRDEGLAQVRLRRCFHKAQYHIFFSSIGSWAYIVPITFYTALRVQTPSP